MQRSLRKCRHISLLVDGSAYVLLLGDIYWRKLKHSARALSDLWRNSIRRGMHIQRTNKSAMRRMRINVTTMFPLRSAYLQLQMKTSVNDDFNCDTQKNKTPLRFRCLQTAAIRLTLLIIIYECFVLITRYRSCFSFRVRTWFPFNLLDPLARLFRGIQDISRSIRLPSFRHSTGIFSARETAVFRAEDATN